MLIKNGTLYTIDNGVKAASDLRISNGKISQIGQNLAVDDNETVIDATGKLVFPGFIDAHCHIGMWEEGIGFEGADGNEMTDPVTSHVRAIDAINPMDESFENALSGGVTCACTGPGSANVIGGTFTVLKLYGKRVDTMVIKDNMAMKCAFGENPKRVYNEKKQTPMTRMGTAAILRETLAKAKHYSLKVDAAAGDLSKMPEYDIKLEALIPVIKRHIPLKAHAHRADDIFTSIRIAKEYNVRLTLDHCTEGHLIAQELAEEGYAAIVGPSFGNKSKFELKEKSYKTAGVLAKAGVKVAIMTDSPVIPIEHLNMCASLAVKAGMDEAEALKAITLSAAEILEVDDRIGSLTVGKDGDVVIWDRHPFDLQAKADCVIVNGEIAWQLRDEGNKDEN